MRQIISEVLKTIPFISDNQVVLGASVLTLFFLILIGIVITSFIRE